MVARVMLPGTGCSCFPVTVTCPSTSVVPRFPCTCVGLSESHRQRLSLTSLPEPPPPSPGLLNCPRGQGRRAPQLSAYLSLLHKAL